MWEGEGQLIDFEMVVKDFLDEAEEQEMGFLP